MGLHASFLRLHCVPVGADLVAHLLQPWAAGLLLDPQALQHSSGGAEAEEVDCDGGVGATSQQQLVAAAEARVAALTRRHAGRLPMYTLADD